MQSIVLKANAKINLFLDILGKRDDGFHDIFSIMQSVSLADEVTLTKNTGQGLRLECSDPHIPSDERNIAMKMARKIEQWTERRIEARIAITKRIPSEAGLAGGSADGAAVLLGMNELLELRLSLDDMIQIAQTVGSDIPFCLTGGTCLAEGKGERLARLTPIDPCRMVIIKPTFSISTAWAYTQYSSLNIPSRERTDIVERILDPCTRPSFAYNIFERICSGRFREIEIIKETCRDMGADYVLMSGSGSAFFAASEKRAVLDAIHAHYVAAGYTAYYCSTVTQGVEIVGVS